MSELEVHAETARRTPDTILQHPDAEVSLSPVGDKRLRVCVRPKHADLYVQGSPLVTRYSPELIALILEVKGPGYLCDEIARDEDPGYTRVNLEVGLFSFLGPEAFSAKRLLDFGCGSAASSMILARLLPETNITGVELVADSLRVARARARFHGQERVSFLQSPSGTTLPADLGRFDFIVMNAVFEHLLPEERMPILSALWRVLESGGVLFLQETPNRHFPLELHTTGLPLINYLPDALAASAARRLSARVDAGASWTYLLRAGIRGGTLREVAGLLRKTGEGEPEFLAPTRLGRRDAVDLWQACSSARHGRSAKTRAAAIIIRGWRQISGIALVPELSLAIRKRGD